MKTVRQDSGIDAIVDFAAERWERGQDAWDAVVWALARDPGVGMPVTNSGRTRSFTLEGAKSIRLPTVTVLYVYDGDVITVFDVNFC